MFFYNLSYRTNTFVHRLPSLTLVRRSRQKRRKMLSCAGLSSVPLFAWVSSPSLSTLLFVTLVSANRTEHRNKFTLSNCCDRAVSVHRVFTETAW